MPWIDQTPVDAAADLLKHEFDTAIRRAGRVWNVVHIMSLNPRVLKASMDHYRAIMFGASPLSRVQRELLATVVSAELECRY